jgi:hypothetical protein
MKRFLSLLAIITLSQCNGFNLPKPGEPVRNDIDERSGYRDEAGRAAAIEADNRYPDAEAQSAFDLGYSIGYLDKQRGKPSDPEPHMGRANPTYRTPFVAGYVAGFNK